MLILTAGLSSQERHKIGERFRAKELVKLQAGIYVPSVEFHLQKEWERYRLRCMAAAITRPSYTLVGKSAAAMWRVPYGEVPKYVEQARVGGSGGARSKYVRLRTLVVLERQPILNFSEPHDKGKVTSLAQTLVDIARWHGIPDAVCGMDHAMREAMVSRAGLESVLEEVRDHHGAKFAEQAVALAHPAGESPRESLIRMRIWRAKLPAPQMQANIWDHRGDFLGRVDLFFPEYSIAVEYDGRGKYNGEFGQSVIGAMQDERWRERGLLNAGIRVIRVDRENFRDESWLEDLTREINRTNHEKLVFPKAQWSSAGIAW
ncbi:hypothetical protein [Corynebacterium sp. A21]|uniref:hypothetical protein n=1 Tax=Corynebacterium sp. A21 TaxID=3457318 RepID=UPI003FD001B0